MENQTTKREAVVCGVFAFLICFGIFMFVRMLMADSYSDGRYDEAKVWEDQNHKLLMENINLTEEINRANYESIKSTK